MQLIQKNRFQDGIYTSRTGQPLASYKHHSLI